MELFLTSCRSIVVLGALFLLTFFFTTPVWAQQSNYTWKERGCAVDIRLRAPGDVFILSGLFPELDWFKKDINVEGVPTLKGVECVFGDLISVVLSLAGVVLFIMLIYGGFKYLTAGGDPKALEGAKGTLSHAILGLIVLVLAFIILKVIAEVTGVSSILNFQIYRP